MTETAVLDESSVVANFWYGDDEMSFLEAFGYNLMRFAIYGVAGVLTYAAGSKYLEARRRDKEQIARLRSYTPGLLPTPATGREVLA